MVPHLHPGSRKIIVGVDGTHCRSSSIYSAAFWREDGVLWKLIKGAANLVNSSGFVVPVEGGTGARKSSPIISYEGTRGSVVPLSPQHDPSTIPTHSISHNPQTPRRQRQRSALSQLPSSSSSETPQTHDRHHPPSARRANHPNFHPDTHTRWGLVKVKKRNWGFGRSVSGRHEGQEKGSVGGRKPRGRCRW